MGHMDRPTKALIIGIGLGALVAAGGFLNALHLERRVDNLSAQCQSQSRQERESPNPPAWGGILVCDPNTLIKPQDQESPPGVQGQIIATQQSLERARRWPLPVGFAIAVIFALPWAWYFLLNRIREFRNAIR